MDVLNSNFYNPAGTSCLDISHPLTTCPLGASILAPVALDHPAPHRFWNSGYGPECSVLMSVTWIYAVIDAHLMHYICLFECQLVLTHGLELTGF